MRKVIYLSLILILSILSENIFAQNDLPRLSPKAFVGQTVGYTEISITYGSPGVKGRKIFGELVPYKEVWRTGANEATTIEFSNDVLINDRTVPAGRYSLFTIPDKKEWTVIFNKTDEQWGAFKYDQKEDLMRFKVKPSENGFAERLKFNFEYKTPFTSDIVLSWENIKMSFEVNSKLKKKE